MTVQATVVNLMVASGIGMGMTIAPVAPAIAQGESVCQQAGTGYQEVYTFQTGDRSVTICQKGDRYVYVPTPQK
jgi:hypothetical protein